MRTREAFSEAETYELRSLFLHFLEAHRNDSPRGWWVIETTRWCNTQPDRFGYDSRPHLVALIERILELGWDDQRLRRLIDLHVIRTDALPPEGLSTQEFLQVVRELVRVHLTQHPVMRRSHENEE
jgi:hypothetical protein